MVCCMFGAKPVPEPNLLQIVVPKMLSIVLRPSLVNILRLRENGRLFADHIFETIFFNENISITINISLKFVPKGEINNISAVVQIMAWHQPGDKPLSEPMMVSLLAHIYVTQS